MSSFIRARRPDDLELTINLIELEDALEGGAPGEYYFLPDSGRISFLSARMASMTVVMTKNKRFQTMMRRWRSTGRKAFIPDD